MYMLYVCMYVVGLTSLRPGSFLSHRTVMLGYRINKTKERLEEILGRKPTGKILMILYVCMYVCIV